VYDKVAKARGIRGLRYLHMSTPCPSGWGFEPKDTVRVGKLAVDCGLVVLYEVEEGAFRLTGRSEALARSGKQLTPVTEFFAGQSRYSRLGEDAAAHVQAWVDARWAGYRARHEAGR